MKAKQKNVYSLPVLVMILATLMTLSSGLYEGLMGGEFDSARKDTGKCFQGYQLFIVEDDGFDISMPASFPVFPEQPFDFFGESSSHPTETTCFCQRNSNLRC
jgi:hypothetical protein